MKRLRLPYAIRKALLSATFWRLLPTPATLYLNKQRIRKPEPVPQLPKTEWSRRERRALLTASEERVRNLESKGPGLATGSAVIVAGVLLAIGNGWDDSMWLGRVILAAAALYSALSLTIALYVVGPLSRNVVHVAELRAAADANDPEENLAHSAAEGATANDLRNLRLGNLLDAGRRELTYALVLLLLWVLFVPVTCVLRV
jgi:phage shock protein PspC (stress-responsive transcriptional regulator)